MNKWDQRFLDLATLVGSWSKDATKVGAVIVAPNRSVVSVGFNGFPMGCDDAPEIYADRPRKLLRVVHAERNALIFACRPVTGCTLYTVPFAPCCQCAALFVQAGIKRVVAPVCPPAIAARWADDLKEAALLFAEAGVKLSIVETQ